MVNAPSADELHGRDPVGRVVQLDWLRGVAAVVVAAYHWRTAFRLDTPRWYAQPFFAGHESVILFFVLSGYVLSLPVWANRQPSYGIYFVRRVTRIYLPYLGALALACVGCWFFAGSHLPLTRWFQGTWQKPLTLHLVLQQLLIPPSADLNTAFWSLRYEMEMSIVFPAVCLLMTRFGRYSGILLFVALRQLSIATAGTPIAHTALLTGLHYAMFFVAGASLARETRPLKRFVARWPGWMPWVALVAAMVVFLRNGVADTYTALGACAFIILVQDRRVNREADSPPLMYLGRISYSLYLVHGTVLFSLLYLFYGKLPLSVLAVLDVVMMFLVAHLFCVLVEEPSLRLGKRLTRPKAQRAVERSAV